MTDSFQIKELVADLECAIRTVTINEKGIKTLNST